MARSKAVNDLRSEIRLRSGVKSVTVSDAELLAIMNAAAADLHDMIVRHGEDQYLDYWDIDIVADTETYALDADFYKVRGVSVLRSSGEWDDMPVMAFEHRHHILSGAKENLHYAIVGSTMRVYPSPDFSETGCIRVWFVPAYTVLVAGESVDYINDWCEYIRLFCLIELAELMGEPVTSKERRLERLSERISNAVMTRDLSEPPRVLLEEDRSPRRRYLDNFGKTV